MSHVATPADIDRVLKELEPLFTEATEKKLWFFCHYQELWFSPLELKVQMEHGKFLWPAKNWQLRNPLQRIDQLNDKIRELSKEMTAILTIIKNG